jgi:hypothetical protein
MFIISSHDNGRLNDNLAVKPLNHHLVRAAASGTNLKDFEE